MEDPAEAIFKRLARLWHRVRGSGRNGAPKAPGAVALEAHWERFEVLAALLSGEALELHGADDGVGGVAGTTLLLPRHLHLVPEAERNLEAYLVRIAYSCVSREMGFHLAPDLGDGMGPTVATLLAVPPTRARLRDRYPAGARVAGGLAAALLGGRPAPDGRVAGGVLEAWTRRLLGEPDPLGEGAPAPVRAFLDTAMGTEVATPGEVHRCARELLPRLEACVEGRRGKPPPGVPLWGRLLPRPEDTPVESTDEVPDAADPGSAERRVVELDKTIRLQRRVHGRREDKPLFHMFEKVETAEEHRGEGGTPDTEGDVRQMEDALDELSLGTVIRTTDDPSNLVRADVIMDPTELDVRGRPPTAAPRVFRYPEWDFKKERYQEDHCTVREERLVAGEAGAAHAAASREVVRGQRRQVDELRMHLLRSLYRRRVRNRQMDGPDIDVEAVVERHADLMAGRTPPERLYLAARKAMREVAILVLVDTSFSTDAWLEGRRVLDVEMQSLLILAEAFAGHLEEEVAVASFHSHTRHDVRFGVLKGFEDRWEVLRRVAPGLVPGGYTRIGAAMRHATAVLDATRANRKLLLLVSDGKPTDFDRYEGRYGVEDVSRAVREAGQRRVHVFGLAIEKEAKLHLARMLGPGSYRILPRTTMLPDAMAEVFVGMLTG
jgi:nitric oxide reductase NorD protein